ncbi:MAG: hypothetical protein R3B54_10255 [Bdellovibrionota bacterium]
MTTFSAPIRGREVTLEGLAEPDLWAMILLQEDLAPAVKNGKVPIFLSSVECKVGGLSFVELSISVALESGPENLGPSVYLAHALNSSWFYSTYKRWMSHSPHFHAPVRNFAGKRPALGVKGVFRGRVGEGRDFGAAQNESWEGKIFLRAQPGKHRYFAVRVSGNTISLPFDAASDEFNLARPEGVFGMLADSHFVPQTWHIRRDVSVATSKTVQV